VVDLYERQVTRSKSPSDRVDALARAAQVAAARGQVDRARGFLDLALSGAPSDEAVTVLERAAREGDQQTGGDALRRALSGALEQGGQGARDGGRTRGALLRRAALMTHRDLKDLDEAFVLLGVALVAHVDPLTLDALEALAEEVAEPRRAEETLTHVLEEVFDGPLVRLLLARRAKLRREVLGDTAGAAADLKKLHDLSPNDAAVLTELTALLTELGDYRGMVRVFEDQILRGKDMSARAELARKVARMWEVELSDAREAADAWRRVLRMKQGDTEATAGLERAKSNMLKTLDPNSERRPSAAPAPAASEAPAEAPPSDVVGSTSPSATETTSEPEPPPAVAQDVAPVEHAEHEVAPPAESIEASGVMGLLDALEAEDRTHLDQPAAVPSPAHAPPNAIDFSDATLPHSAAAPPPTESELVIDVDASGEAPALDDDEMVLADDVTEVEGEADGVAAEPEPAPAPAKRTVPPPLPRSG
jgi:tetratricopeptide (TPR) repeat protein